MARNSIRKLITVFSDRCVVTLVLSVFGICVYGANTRPSYSGLPPDSFWRAKMAAVGTADVVVAGDSRVYRGVDPVALAGESSSGVVVNFGFSGTGFDKGYLNATRGMLSSTGARVIVLGVTPHSLTTAAVLKNTYNDYKQFYGVRLHPWQILVARILDRVPPITFANLRNMLFSRPPNNLSTGPRTHFSANGYAARLTVGQDSDQTRKTMRHYSTIFNANQVAEPIVLDLFRFCEDCRASGVIVVAFRPPTTDEMEAIENSESGFNKSMFAASFEEAGGVWLEVAPDGLETYDGDHLDGQSATLFSKRIGKALSEVVLERNFKSSGSVEAVH